MTLEVRAGATEGADDGADREFVIDLGRRTVMSSVASRRPVHEAGARAAFDRLFDLVESQPHRTLIARRDGRRVGFLLMLDALPDEVTLLPQAFVAYMAVEPAARGAGVGAALLSAAEDEARRQGLPYIALMVTEENAPALRLYERSGYRAERRLLCKPL